MTGDAGAVAKHHSRLDDGKWTNGNITSQLGIGMYKSEWMDVGHSAKPSRVNR